MLYICNVNKAKLKKNNMKTTNLFIVLNEDTLNTLKGKGNKTAKFETEEEANTFAGGKLEAWTVVKVNFTHEFINHEVN